MTTKEADATRERYEAGQALLRRMEREERNEFERSDTDPEFTVDDIVRMTKFSHKHVRDLLHKAGVGFHAIRPHLNGGGSSRTRVVRYSQLKTLAVELGWVKSDADPHD